MYLVRFFKRYCRKRSSPPFFLISDFLFWFSSASSATSALEIPNSEEQLFYMMLRAVNSLLHRALQVESAPDKFCTMTRFVTRFPLIKPIYQN